MKRSSDAAAEPPLPGASPVFLPREKRQRLALERRRQAAAADQRSIPRPSPPPPLSKPPRDSSDRDRCRGRGRDPYPDRHIREKEGRVEKMAAQRAREKELDAIKEQYLGYSSSKDMNDRKKNARTMATKLRDRFRFDWDSAEDTTRDDGTGAGPLLLYGRGFLAGIDRRQQKKAAAAAAALQKKLPYNDEDLDDTRADRRHGTAKALLEMTERDWRILREDFDISYKGSRSGVPRRPMRTWAESSLGDPLLRAVAVAGYDKPTPIQMAAVPLGLQRRDLIGVAQTGSGKTAAFVLPMLAYIMNLMTSPPPMTMLREADDDHDPQGPYAVVMAPTHELAQQIERETTKLAAAACHGSIKVVSVVGGQPIEEQAFRIRQGCEVIVATPGRLLDCLERRHLVLNRCSYVVLDEADRMVDMGFEPQVASVLDAMPTSNLKPENEAEELDEQKKVYRTTHMFSATMPAAVERLARKYLRDPVVVTVGGSAGKATELFTQNVTMFKDSEKLPRLKRILAGLGDDNTAIVFCNTKMSVDSCAKDLDRAGFRVATLHGGKSQDQREASLDGFRSRRFNVLVATDIAGRGIDVPDVAHVINYEMPGAVDAYTHRIGRTGRAGKKGLATSFLTLRDSEILFVSGLRNSYFSVNNRSDPMKIFLSI